MYEPVHVSVTLVFSVLLLLVGIAQSNTPPNIIIILADDLGWNDVSFHGSNQYMTPNIDALAWSGVILQDYYTQPICTPARAALLTGRHPINNGMHHDVIYAPQPWGVPLSNRLMPQYLKSLGYVSRAVGKWHLGCFKRAYTPTRRGFDSFYGTWMGHQNHFTHTAYEPHPGYDMHRDLNISWEAKGKYAADVFTEEAETIINNHNVSRPLFLYLSHAAPHAPLQAPKQVIKKFTYIANKKRRIFAAMVAKLDEAVGRVTQALKNKNMLKNSIILFLSDNGGATHGFNGNVASNWPLRGGKDTLWEGGVRGVGLIWSPLLQGAPRVHHGLINVQDWLPTLLSAAGATRQFKGLDGVSQWKALNNEGPAPYHTMLHNIDRWRKIAALRYKQWKLIKGRTYRGHFDGWNGEVKSSKLYNVTSVSNSAAGQAVQTTSSPLPDHHIILSLRNEATISCKQHKYKGKSKKCKPHLTPCLFDIQNDPCEYNNLASSYPDIVKRMMNDLVMNYKPVKPNNKLTDPRSFPYHWNNTWTTWQDFV